MSKSGFFVDAPELEQEVPKPEMKRNEAPRPEVERPPDDRNAYDSDAGLIRGVTDRGSW